MAYPGFFCKRGFRILSGTGGVSLESEKQGESLKTLPASGEARRSLCRFSHPTVLSLEQHQEGGGDL